MSVTDLAISKNIENLLHEHMILLAHITILYPLVAHIKITLVLVNASLVVKSPLLDDTNHHIVLLLNLVLIAIEVYQTQNLKITPTIITNPLLISLNNQLH